MLIIHDTPIQGDSFIVKSSLYKNVERKFDFGFYNRLKIKIYYLLALFINSQIGLQLYIIHFCRALLIPNLDFLCVNSLLKCLPLQLF